MAKQGKIRNVGSNDGGIILNDDGTEITFYHPFVGSLGVAPGYYVNYEGTTDADGKPLAIEVRPIRIGIVQKLNTPVKRYARASGVIVDEITGQAYDFYTFIDSEDTKIAEKSRVRYEVVAGRSGQTFATHLSIQRAKNIPVPEVNTIPTEEPGGTPAGSR